jgi:hypothetical protein
MFATTHTGGCNGRKRDSPTQFAGRGGSGSIFCNASQAHAQAGQLDPTFGTGGIHATSTSKSTANAVPIQSDGKIVVAGGGIPNSQNLADTLFRLNSNGTLDTGLGSAGVDNIVPSQNGDFGADGFFGVAIQSDGKIVGFAATMDG